MEASVWLRLPPLAALCKTEASLWLQRASEGVDASPFMLLSGFVAAEGQWHAFEVGWREVWKEVGLSQFHATDRWGRMSNVGEKFGPKDLELTSELLMSLLQNSSNAANFPCVCGAERPALRLARA